MPEGIIKEGDRWRARFMVDGKRRSATFPTQREARKWRTDQLAKADQGRWVDPRLTKISLGEYAQRWLESNRAHWKPKSYAANKVRVGYIPEPDVPIGSVTATQVKRWMGQVAQDVGVPSANLMRRVLVSIYRQAMEDGIVGKSPITKSVKKLPHKPAEKEILTPQELDALLASLDAGEWRDAAMFMAFTGMRASDGLTVTNQHVDLVNQRVYCGNVKVSRGHWLPLAAPIRDMVLRRAESGGYLFSLRGTHPLDVANFNKKLKAAAKKAGIDKDVSTHCLRHTCASWLIASGASILAVRDWLGHKDVQTTVNVYGHLFPDALGDLADTLGAMWDERGERRLKAVE